uniref:(northern house mosquito) hypothetical protein n=1 Tax=Culex pipiens TaxID=7175 RepID=A0A8D8BNY1_CULPI
MRRGKISSFVFTQVLQTLAPNQPPNQSQPEPAGTPSSTRKKNFSALLSSYIFLPQSRRRPRKNRPTHNRNNKKNRAKFANLFVLFLSRETRKILQTCASARVSVSKLRGNLLPTLRCVRRPTGD